MNKRNLFDNRDSRGRKQHHFFLLGNDSEAKLLAGQFCKICFSELPRQIYLYIAPESGDVND
ncbi:Uncharacterized protein dnm_009310 [Desulfonema magnum]|uniref:Uncharacterized protein n=1 Tax=Desulfonema magnum TaxID=45655 RepID=A0A975GLK9_9BACT|nr:Uncharacterized protein dnm_009310 [Desulfonema magnum]